MVDANCQSPNPISEVETSPVSVPDRLKELHAGEEDPRQKALSLVEKDEKLSLHLAMVENAMDLCDLLRQFETDDEDLKVVQVFGMRMFNAFGAALKLTLSGITRTAPSSSATSWRPSFCWTCSASTYGR